MSNVIGVKITGDGTDLQKALQGAGRDVESFGKKVSEASGPLDTLANGFKSAFVGSSVAVGIISVKNAIGDMTGALVQAQVQVDQLRNGLNFAVGRSNAAGEMDFVRASAKSMGLEFASAGSQYVKLAAAARGTTLEGQKTRDIFLAVAQASTVLGLSSEQTEGALRALGQMISKNTVMSEELKGQFSEHIPGGFQIAARAMGVTTGELNKMLAAGQVMADDLLPKMAAEMTKVFSPEADAAAQSMRANINKLTTAWIEFKQATAQSGASAVIANEAQGITNYLTVLTEAMDRSRKSGDGLAVQWSTTLGTALARVPFDVAATSANMLNGTINLLTGGVLGLKTNINLLPQIFETNAQKSAALGGRLTEAEAELAKLQSRLAVVPDNIYLKSETYQAYLLVQELRAAKEAQDKLKGASVTPTQAGMRLSGEAREAWTKANEANLASLQKLKDQQNGVPDGYAKGLAEIERLYAAGTITGREYTDMLDKQHALLNKKGGITEAAKGLALYNDLLDTSAGFEKTWAESVNQLRAALDAKLISQDKFNAAVSALLAKQPAIKAAADEEKKIAESVTKSHFDAVIAQQKHTASIQEQLNKQLEHNATIGLSKEAIADLEAATMNLQATELERQASLKDSIMWDSAITDGYLAQAKALRELALAKATGAQKQAAVTAAADMAAAQKKAAEESGKYWEDALMRAFESGKGFFDSLWSTIKNTLKTQVLKVTVQGTMSALGIGAAGAAAAGDVSNLSTLGNVAGIGSFGSSAINGLGLAATGFGQAAAATFSNGLISGFSVNMGNIGALASGGSYLTALGAAMPYVGAAAAIYTLGDSLWGGGGGPKTESSYGNMAGLGNTSATGLAGSYALGIEDAYNTLAKQLGLSSKLKVGALVSADPQGNDNTDFNVAAVVDGKQVYDRLGRMGGRNPSQTGRSDAELQAAMTEEMTRVLFSALKASDLPAQYKTYLNSVGSSVADMTTAMANVTVVHAFTDALNTLPFKNLRDLSFDAAKGLIEVAGGLDNLQTNLGTYYTNFYSAEEQRAQTIANINKATAGSGLDAATATRASFRALVDAQDLTTASGRSTYAALISVSGALATVVDAATSVDKAFTDLISTLDKSLTSVLNNITSARAAVSDAIAGLNPTQMTLAQIKGGIANATLTMPTNAGVLAANAKADAADALKLKAQAEVNRTAALLASANTTLGSAQAKATTDAAALAAAIANPAAKYLANYADVAASGYWSSRPQDHYAMHGQYEGRVWGAPTAAESALAASNNAAVASATTKVAAAQTPYNTATSANAAALAQQTAAVAAAKAAAVAYATAMNTYAGDAEKATTALGKLRDETVKYYETQKALASLMTTSAVNLRSAVSAAKGGQLSTAQSLAQQQADYAKNYSLALATSADTQAAYADKLTAALPTLTTSLMDTASSRTEWALATSKVYAQAEKVASLIDANVAGMTYQADSLAALTSIDVTLAALQAGTNTAAGIIRAAVNAGADLTAQGLRAVVKQLGGVPAFASGGYHAGGIRLVGENGPELEVTGPSHIFNASQLRGSGGGNMARLEQLVQALTEEVANLRIEARATASNTNKTAKILERVTPDGNSLQTVAAA